MQRGIVPRRKGRGGVCLSREVSPSEEPPFHISSLGAKRNQLTLQLEPINPRKSTTPPSTVAVFNKWDKCNKSINKKGERHRLGLPGYVRWAPDSSETAQVFEGLKQTGTLPKWGFRQPWGTAGMGLIPFNCSHLKAGLRSPSRLYKRDEERSLERGTLNPYLKGR